MGEEAGSSMGSQAAVSVALRQVAMPEMGDDRLGSILNRHYVEGLGGPQQWSQVVSVRVFGRLSQAGGEFKFKSYRKKPHLIKMMISGSQRHMKMGYDGRTVWQVAAKGAPALQLPEDQARRFIHGARFGNYLLYPYAQGKRMEYLDTVPVDGIICHQIRVTLDTGYQVDYFVDIRSYLEVQVVTTDLKAGTMYSVVYEDYIRVCGLPIARKVVRSEDGVWVSTLEVDDVKVNSGVMPWMFELPK
jgi:hypothetical protein